MKYNACHGILQGAIKRKNIQSLIQHKNHNNKIYFILIFLIFLLKSNAAEAAKKAISLSYVWPLTNSLFTENPQLEASAEFLGFGSDDDKLDGQIADAFEILEIDTTKKIIDTAYQQKIIKIKKWCNEKFKLIEQDKILNDADYNQAIQDCINEYRSRWTEARKARDFLLKNV